MRASDLTFDEQAALTAGVDMWHTAGVDRLGIAGIGVTDGPSGARGTEFTGSSLDVAALRHRSCGDLEPRADRTGRPPPR